MQTYQAEEDLEPEVIQAVYPVLLVEVDEPSSTVHVGLVFPHGLDPCLEHAVVATGDEARGQLDVVVHAPEILNKDVC